MTKIDRYIFFQEKRYFIFFRKLAKIAGKMEIITSSMLSKATNIMSQCFPMVLLKIKFQAVDTYLLTMYSSTKHGTLFLKLTDQNYAKVRKISQKYAKVCQ
jgi:hypothetical protein